MTGSDTRDETEINMTVHVQEACVHGTRKPPLQPGIVLDVLHEVYDERAQQDAKWGEQNHPDRMPEGYPYGDSPDYAKAARYWQSSNATRVTWMNAAGASPDRNAAWEGLLLKQVYEAVAECGTAALRAELVKVAAVALVWVEAIDRRAANTTQAERSER